MTPGELSAAVVAVLRDAVSEGALPLALEDLPAEVSMQRPKVKDHGDYATNVAMQLAKPAGMPPRAVAELIAGRLATVPGIKSVEVAGPGFLNVVLDAASAGELARAIVVAGTTYGRGDVLAGQRINIEFVSANPTGPLHLGHTRWAAVGDAIGRVLAAAGAAVTREFYVNDRGTQMDHFGASIMAAAHGRPTPTDGYHGDYIADLAAEIVAEQPTITQLPEAEQLVAFREAGYTLQLAQQRATLDAMRTHFDVWTSEQALYDSGAVERGLARLREAGHVYESEGAVWLRTTDFGDDRDRVLVRGDGNPAYLLADCAYYVDKRSRGFTRAIYLLGADHHGYVGRLKAVAACAGDDPEQTLDILIGQLVKILKGGEEVRLSKRAGDIVTLEDFVAAAGVDAARYSLCRHPVDSPLTLDLEVITRQANDNPVYYVQYVAARTAAVQRNAEDLGLALGDPDDFRPDLLEHDLESALLGALGEFPRVVATAAELREPHRVARYLEELAAAYHRFYDPRQNLRILPRGDDPATDVMRSRLWLNAATRVVIENGLDLLGVTAPDRM